jgi:hypothetical protein
LASLPETDQNAALLQIARAIKDAALEARAGEH